MKTLYAEGVIGKIKISFDVSDDLEIHFKSESVFTEVPTAIAQMGFTGQDGIDKAKAIAHEVAVGTPIEGKLGLKRDEVEKGVKSANPENPKQVKDAQEKKAPRPAELVQQEVIQPTEVQQQEIQQFTQEEEKPAVEERF